jgi:hypothetical protein
MLANTICMQAINSTGGESAVLLVLTVYQDRTKVQCHSPCVSPITIPSRDTILTEYVVVCTMLE